jgi:hypothetical protein
MSTPKGGDLANAGIGKVAMRGLAEITWGFMTGGRSTGRAVFLG